MTVHLEAIPGLAKMYQKEQPFLTESMAGPAELRYVLPKFTACYEDFSLTLRLQQSCDLKHLNLAMIKFTACHDQSPKAHDKILSRPTNYPQTILIKNRPTPPLLSEDYGQWRVTFFYRRLELQLEDCRTWICFDFDADDQLVYGFGPNSSDDAKTYIITPTGQQYFLPPPFLHSNEFAGDCLPRECVIISQT